MMASAAPFNRRSEGTIAQLLVDWRRHYTPNPSQKGTAFHYPQFTWIEHGKCIGKLASETGASAADVENVTKGLEHSLILELEDLRKAELAANGKRAEKGLPALELSALCNRYASTSAKRMLKMITKDAIERGKPLPRDPENLVLDMAVMSISDPPVFEGFPSDDFVNVDTSPALSLHSADTAPTAIVIVTKPLGVSHLQKATLDMLISEIIKVAADRAAAEQARISAAAESKYDPDTDMLLASTVIRCDAELCILWLRHTRVISDVSLTLPVGTAESSFVSHGPTSPSMDTRIAVASSRRREMSAAVAGTPFSPLMHMEPYTSPTTDD